MFVNAAGIRHYYRLDGRDDRPVVVFAHSLGCDHSQWDDQAEALAPYFRVLRYDIRGHGATDVTPGDYSIELLARDVLAIADALPVDRFAFCGLSLGGMIGQWLAANTPQRITHLVLANTSSKFPDPAPMEARRREVLERGMTAVADMVLGRFFSANRIAANAPEYARTRRVLLATDPVGYAGCCAAVRDLNQTALLPRIKAPTLIISSVTDASTPWAGHGDALAQGVPHPTVELLPTAHLSNLERPRSFNAALFRLLMPPSPDTLAVGMAKRRATLGDEYVDRAVAATNDFTRGFQDLITRFAWGTAWQRPGLDDRTRRLLALTALAALGRLDEFRLHVRTGFQHELEAADLEETLLQLAIYAGIPAANAGFHIAREEMGKV